MPTGPAEQRAQPERWEARRWSLLHYRIATFVVAIGVGGGPLELFGGWEGIAEYGPWGDVLGLAWVALAFLGGAGFFWWVKLHPTLLTISGPWLVFTKGSRTRRAFLAPGAIVAGRRAVGRGHCFDGSDLVVRCEDGELLVLHVPAILPDDRYQTDTQARADLWVEPGEEPQRLMEQLLPFVLRRPTVPESLPLDDATGASTYTIPLLPFGSNWPDKAGSFLYLTGSSLALGDVEGRCITAQGPLAKISVVPLICSYEDYRGTDYYPGISIRFPTGGDVRLVARGTDSMKDWWGRSVVELDTRDEPWVIGEPQLRLLMRVFGLVQGA